MDNSSFITRIMNSVTTKIIFIFFMTLVLMIPNLMIQSLIRERSGRKASIEQEVAKSYGLPQTVLAPVLKVPYTHTFSGDDGTLRESKGSFSFAPQTTNIDGDITSDTRKRSIYEVVIYNSSIDIKQTFDLSIYDSDAYSDYKLDYSRAYLVFGISDANGLDADTAFSINGQAVSTKGLLPAEAQMDWVESKRFSVDPSQLIKLDYNLKLKGTKAINFEPIGTDYKLKIQSTWKDPSFVGSKLPNSYTISESGFESNWALNKFAHNFPEYSLSEGYLNMSRNSFGVNLILPVDEYGKNSRTAKYALLIIALTFGIFFFFEILYKKQLHPIQYLLVGFALTIFFLLLLSITEHWGFNLAYLISSIATIGLIVTYVAAVLQNKRSSMLLLGLLISLFGYIFVILQLQDFALLAGAIALFIILAAVMLISRKIDWYNLNND